MDCITHCRFSDYDILEPIGQGNNLNLGAFSIVFAAIQIKDQQLVAIKRLTKSDIIKNRQVDHIYNEISIMSKLKVSQFTQLYGIAQDDKFFYIIMELVQGGSFYMQLRNQVKYSPQVAAFYGFQIVLMVEYMHDKDIIYRDLKPENLLFDKDGYLKLTDFGFSKVVVERTYTLCGTPEYIAPEIILNQGHSKPVDWWAFGVLLYELIQGFNLNLGVDPFYNSDPMQIYQNILKVQYKFPPDFDQSAKSLIRHLLVTDLSKRYGCLRGGVNDILQHKFFQCYDPIKLQNKLIKPPFIPNLKSNKEYANFQTIQDNKKEIKSINPDLDPFINW